MSSMFVTVDGNEAAAFVAHRASEVIAIYPITPASPMGELADAWSAAEAAEHLGHGAPRSSRCRARRGAAGAVHGALQAGALTTTFTASQGLLLMIPNMFKIAGELTSDGVPRRGPHGRHACAVDLRRPQRRDGRADDRLGDALLRRRCRRRRTWPLIAHAATLEARVPFLHFFDGFRTSHEVNEDRAALPRTTCAR